MKLSNQRILITGGGSGIGLALARILIERGNRVLICGRDAAKLNRAANDINGLEIQVCDLAQTDSLSNLIEVSRQKLGALTVLINNAAVQLNYDFTKSDQSEVVSNIDFETAVNFTALAKLTALALPLLKQCDESGVVNLSSGLGIVPKRTAPVYCATKAAVHIFSKSLRYQFENFNRENKKRMQVFEAILPLVETPMTEGRGSGKISAHQAASEIVEGIERGKSEIHVGKVKFLFPINRFAPNLMARVMRDK